LLAAATPFIEAFVVLHFLGILAFTGQFLPLVAFVLAGIAFYFVAVRTTCEPQRPSR